MDDAEMINKIRLGENIADISSIQEPKGTLYIDYNSIYEYNINPFLIHNGIGTPKNKINYIFHRFYQVDESLTRNSEGSGIGLCIVKEIVEIHKGRIEIQSEVDQGTTFKIYMPIKMIDQKSEEENIRILNMNRIVDLEMSDI